MPPTLNPIPRRAPVEEHRKHAEEFLKIEDYKDPKKVNRPEYQDVIAQVPDEPGEANKP
jgi:hypothetical protein